MDLSLDGTGLLGGPLVTASNVSDRSDLRLYSSDNNATMQALSEEVAFRTKCFDVFERMINTVPTGSSLTDAIVPMAWKAVDLATDINSQGVVSIGGLIRNLYSSGSALSSVSYSVSADTGNFTATTSTRAGSGSSLFGTTAYYSFNTTIDSPGSTILSFGDVTYPINDNIFILPVKSTTGRNTATIRAAILTSLVTTETPKLNLWVPGSVSGTRARQIATQTATLTQYSTAGNYTLFQATVSGNVGSGSGTIVKAVLGDLASQTIKTDIFG